jgi:hypothetical protein
MLRWEGVVARRTFPAPILTSAFFIAVMAAASGARASPPDAAGADPEAARRYEEGLAAAEAQRWNDARVAFLAAFSAHPSASIAAPLGRAELMVGRHRDAAEHLAYFLRVATDARPEDLTLATELLDVARSKVGTLKIRVNVPGTEVRIDGKLVGRAPLPEVLYVEPGPRTLEARAPDRASEPVTIEATPGAKQEVILVLPPRESAPLAPVPAKEDRQAWRTYAFGAGAALALTGLSVGVGLTFAANARSDDAAARLATLARDTPSGYAVCSGAGLSLHPGACSELRQSLVGIDRLHDLAVAGYVVGGVAAAGTVVISLLPRARPLQASGARLGVVPIVHANAQGLVLFGAF